MKSAEGKPRYCVTLFVRASERVLSADRWSDEPTPSGTPSVGERISLKVGLGAYLNHGVAMARLNWGEQDNASNF